MARGYYKSPNTRGRIYVCSFTLLLQNAVGKMDIKLVLNEVYIYVLAGVLTEGFLGLSPL